VWQRPWPNWKLVIPTEATQIVGTLAVVYGWFVTPIGWGPALAVWGYALVAFAIASALKIATYRMLDQNGGAAP
jgi:H+-transporting ATPase